MIPQLWLDAQSGGAINLYYNGSAKKFETTSTGVSVTGDGTITGIANELINYYKWGNSLFSSSVLSWDTGYALIQGQAGLWFIKFLIYQMQLLPRNRLDTSGKCGI